jgi:hypothetical protein
MCPPAAFFPVHGMSRPFAYIFFLKRSMGMFGEPHPIQQT